MPFRKECTFDLHVRGNIYEGWHNEDARIRDAVHCVTLASDHMVFWVNEGTRFERDRLPTATNADVFQVNLFTVRYRLPALWTDYQSWSPTQSRRLGSSTSNSVCDVPTVLPSCQRAQISTARKDPVRPGFPGTVSIFPEESRLSGL